MKSILKYINGLPRSHAEKTHGSAYASGMPDITACVGGRRVEIEVKRPGLGKKSEPTPLQQRRLDTWAKAEAVAMTAHSVAEVKAEFENHGVIR